MYIDSNKVFLRNIATVMGYVLLEVLFSMTVHAAQPSSRLQQKIANEKGSDLLTIIIEPRSSASQASAAKIKNVVSTMREDAVAWTKWGSKGKTNRL